ncbi:GNAT family N-acetyltransferase [Rhizobium alvei]|uniref:GNAT family N-acetyltransferase n=1 Tax=Rhizobium alvei TaxID=1132659 RepID=A0ABT8YIG4_9HYPH|nr:GNAT family N-acetyltransferase [Rhizobium alvei]MDO6963438.1 GNAT family N-acetyltransferase [Rhizobium alvei]
MFLKTERLILRNWTDTDADLFFEINSDPEVMEFFPFRRSREESDELLAKVRATIAETGFGFYCLELAEASKPIGFCGLARANITPPFSQDAIEIGWRLARPYWGLGLVTEAAQALLAYGFGEKGLPEIVSFAVHDNRRSTAVMERIGLKRDSSRDFLHPRVPDAVPLLKPHVTYALTRDVFLAKSARA